MSLENKLPILFYQYLSPSPSPLSIYDDFNEHFLSGINTVVATLLYSMSCFSSGSDMLEALVLKPFYVWRQNKSNLKLDYKIRCYDKAIITSRNLKNT